MEGKYAALNPYYRYFPTAVGTVLFCLYYLFATKECIDYLSQTLADTLLILRSN